MNNFFAVLLSLAFFFAVLFSLASTSCTPAHANSDNAFAWRGAMVPGQTLYIRNLNGPIRALPSSGTEASVRAVKRSPTHDEREVQFAVVEHQGGTTICALWKTDKRACGANGEYGDNHSTGNKTSVEFEIALPRGVHLDLQTVNGSVAAQVDSSAVKATTINGNVSLNAAGPAQVKTVNGAIDATIRAAGKGDIAVGSVNGSIKIHLPENLDADADASVVNGRIRTAREFKDGERGNHVLRARLGKGGRALSMHTVNGSISIE
jgi:hypothetical protein